VNAVAPGFIAAGMASEIPANVIEPIVPMKRAGSAEEVAEVIAFLASNEASYVTGQVIGMDGGMT
jgi:3-oxoacyl-[acyl-carrier protein] reductase